ncbi:homeobox protein siamois-like [Mixophyes fleayi]|uniref:homeobox protein siamois-like n=1 Tax=Mixophyes fleayi TaxID=3061075 RepID=UPI003F4E208B
MDSELDQVLCTVLSLEEDYSLLSLPLRNQDNSTSNIHTSSELYSSVKTQDQQGSITLQQSLLELYTLLDIQEESQTSKLMALKEPTINKSSFKDSRDCFPTSPHALKRKFYEEGNEESKKPRVETEDSRTTTSNNRCRKRTVFNKEQTVFLLNQFDCDPYPDFVRRCQIARITGISEPRIQVWFQNRRARHLLKPNKSQDPQNRKASASGGVCKFYNDNLQNLELFGPLKTCGWS